MRTVKISRRAFLTGLGSGIHRRPALCLQYRTCLL